MNRKFIYDDLLKKYDFYPNDESFILWDDKIYKMPNLLE